MFSYFLNCVIKNSSHFSSIDVTVCVVTGCRILCAVYGTDGAVSVQHVALCCVCGTVGGGRECAAGGFVL